MRQFNFVLTTILQTKDILQIKIWQKKNVCTWKLFTLCLSDVEEEQKSRQVEKTQTNNV